jgi:hypothetical protein
MIRTLKVTLPVTVEIQVSDTETNSAAGQAARTLIVGGLNGANGLVVGPAHEAQVERKD